jgi:hypothetical protein
MTIDDGGLAARKEETAQGNFGAPRQLDKTTRQLRTG